MTGIPHVLDLGFVEMGEFVLLDLRTETQFVDMINDIAQDITAVDLVLDLAEDLANLVFDRIRSARLLLEAVQIREELAINEVAQIVAR